MIVLIQESTRFLPEIPRHPNVVPALREIMISAVFMFRHQRLLPEHPYLNRLPKIDL